MRARTLGKVVPIYGLGGLAGALLLLALAPGGYRAKGAAPAAPENPVATSAQPAPESLPGKLAEWQRERPQRPKPYHRRAEALQFFLNKLVPVNEFQVNTFTAGDQDTPAIGVVRGGAAGVDAISDAGNPSGHAFSPSNLTVNVNDAVIFTNLNIFSHNVVWDSPNSPPNSPDFGPGESWSVVMTNAGIFDYHCGIHGPFMNGTITVNPVAAPGDFVVVWTSFGQDSFGDGVYGQRYDAAGTPQGIEFKVNTYTLYNQFDPAVAMDAAGDFVVVWTSDLQDGNSLGIYAQRYDATGTPQGIAFRVNTTTAGAQSAPAVAMDSGGNFVVAWNSPQDGSLLGIYAQRYDAAGTPQGGEFRVNTFTTGEQSLPAVAMDADGDFVAVWGSDGQDGSGFGIFGQRYDAGGTPLGSEFQVNTYTTSSQAITAAAMDAVGNFVVAWQSSGQDGDLSGVFAQRYDASGTPQGSEFQVNTFTTGSQFNPTVAMDADGDFVVAWRSDNQDGDSSGIFAQRYDAAGTPQGCEFQVNTFTASGQERPAVAMDANGDFIAVWQSFGQDVDGWGVFGRGFPANPTLTIDDVTVTEGDAGTVDAVFTVTLNPTSGSDVTVDFATADDTATAGSDYQSNSGPITILAGTSTGQITVLVNGDTQVEPNETFFVNLSGASGATICDAQGLGTITDDDVIPDATFSGKVKNAARQPVAGATIGAYQAAVLKFSATSAADGRYSLPVAAGTYDLVASKPADGYLDTTKPGLAITAGQTLTKIKFKLFRPSFFQGTVTQKGTTTPIDGTLVEAVKNAVTVASTLTAADGTYSLQVTKGTYTLRASKVGYKTKSKLDQTIGDGATKTVNIALPLLGGGGTAGVDTVSDPNPPGYAFSPANLTVNGNDTVTFTNVSAAPHNVVWDSPNSPPNTPVFNPNESVSVVMTNAGTFNYHCGVHGPAMNGTITVNLFQGTVTQKGTSTPIAGARVEAVKNGVTVVSTTTADDGTYSLQVTKGTYTLRASATGFKTKQKLDQTIGGGATKTVNIALPITVNP